VLSARLCVAQPRDCGVLTRGVLLPLRRAALQQDVGEKEEGRTARRIGERNRSAFSYQESWRTGQVPPITQRRHDAARRCSCPRC
jgi:hypothetical protein